MTFPAHKFAGGALHLVIGAVLLWLFSLLLSAVGWDVPVWLVVVVAYCSFSSGSYLGGFPDTESWLVNHFFPQIERWLLYTRCHVGDAEKKYGWIPAWFFHVKVADAFAHAPKDAAGVPLAPKWWQMKLAWKEKPVIFGLTLWDVHYSYREAALWLLGGLMIWAGVGILLGLAHIVITVSR